MKTTFRHPSCDKDVAVFLDPCHMIKLVRNTFEAKRVIFDNHGEIKWQFLDNLLKIQTKETLNFANKLTPRHLDFRNQIMKVKLATQLLSMSVANALKLCEQIFPSTHFSNMEATVKFIENFNNLFDVMNTRKHGRYGLKKPICPENKKEILDFFNEMKEYILSLEIYVKSRRVRRHGVTMKIFKKNLFTLIAKQVS